MSKAWNKSSSRSWRRIRERILARDGYQCQQCGETEGELHIDHIIPKRMNGQDNDENLQVLCKSCNLRKSGSFFDSTGHPRLFPFLNTPKNASVSHE